MELKVINDIEELKNYRDEWEKLLKEINNDIPFIEFDWIVTWWQYLNKGYELFILAFKDQDKVVGFIPLVKKKMMFYTRVNFIGYPRAIYMDFLLKKECRQNIIKCLVDYLWSKRCNYLVHLNGMFKNTANLEILKENLREKKIPYVTTKSKSAIICINDQVYKSYYENRFSSHFKQGMRRKERRLKEMGNLVFREVDSKEIDYIFKLHSKRWEKRSDTSRFSKGTTKEFFKQLATDETLSLETKVYGLFLDNRLITFSYGIEANGRHVGYRIAHDDDFDKYSVGKLMIAKVIENCFDRKLKIFDIGLGYEPFKAKWTDKVINVERILFPCKGLLPKVVFAIYCGKYKTIEALKKNRTIVKLKRNVFGKIKHLLSRRFTIIIKNKISRNDN